MLNIYIRKNILVRIRQLPNASLLKRHQKYAFKNKLINSSSSYINIANAFKLRFLLKFNYQVIFINMNGFDKSPSLPTNKYQI